MQVIPQAEARRPIAIGLSGDYRVVDAVHAGRCQHASEDALEPERQADIAVMKQHRQKEATLPEFERPRTGTGGQHLQDAIRGRDRHVGGVEAERGGAIKVEVDVVDQVKAPQDRQFMGQDVPEIHAVIQHQDGHGVAGPGREWQPLREANAPPLDHARQRLDQRRLDQINHGQRPGPKNDVAQSSLRFGLGRRAQTPAAFGQHDADRGRHHDRREDPHLGHSA